jgi:membrane-associated protease RseP (regulator of RpoE activity)
VWNVLGVCLGALAVLVSISLHELGHLVAAKAVGMTATRFFVGFGPTVWSVRRRGTEYGLKAVPLGGFVSIAGMNAFDDDADHPNAMWRFPAWRRTVVMAAGPAVHIAVGFVIFWALAATLAFPNPANLGPRVSPEQALAQPAFVSVAACLDADARPDGVCAQPAPAWQAGLREGDRVTRVGDRAVTTYGDLAAAIRSLPAGQPVNVAYLRGGATRYATMTPVWETRVPVDDPHAAPTRTAVVGLGLSFDPALPRTVHHNVFGAAGVAGSWVGIIFSRAGTALTTFPRQVAGLWHAVTGGHRKPATVATNRAGSNHSGEGGVRTATRTHTPPSSSLASSGSQTWSKRAASGCRLSRHACPAGSICAS